MSFCLSSEDDYEDDDDGEEEQGVVSLQARSESPPNNKTTLDKNLSPPKEDAKASAFLDHRANSMMAQHKTDTGVLGLAQVVPNGMECHDDDADADDDESVNWEEVEDDDDQEEEEVVDTESTNAAGLPLLLRPITISFEDPTADTTPQADDINKSNNNKKKKKMVARHKYGFGSLSGTMKLLLDQLQQASWLAFVSHVVFRSSQCSDPMALAVALSIVPPCFWSDDVTSWKSSDPQKQKQKQKQNQTLRMPTVNDLRTFCAWFFDLVSNVERRKWERRRANLQAGAPRPTPTRHTKRHPLSSSHHPSKNPSQVSNNNNNRIVEYVTYLASSLVDDPQLLHPEQQANHHQHMTVLKKWDTMDKLNLFITMTRSIGWRVRMTAAIEPISKDVDVNHPLLQFPMAAFRAVASSSSSSGHHHNNHKATATTTNAKTKARKRARNGSTVLQSSSQKGKGIDASSSFSPLHPSSTLDSPLVGWAEVLCRVEKGRKAPKESPSDDSGKGGMQWVHVDPVAQAVDQPHLVESTLMICNNHRDSHRTVGCPETKKSAKGRSMMKPVTFVMAAEHISPDSEDEGSFYIADVSPRYASSMLKTLQARGVPRKDLATIQANQQSTWWTKAIMEVNRSSTRRNRIGDKARDTLKVGDTLKPNDERESRIEEATAEMLTAAQDGEMINGICASETDELERMAKHEQMPTTKEDFKNNPFYVIPSVLKSNEMLAPKATAIAFFKGQCVFRRSDVSETLSARKWLRRGRRVLASELEKPVRTKQKRRIPVRRRSVKVVTSYDPAAEEADEEERVQDLFAIWQTELWNPPVVGPGDKIPVNNFGNVELELLSPGLVHVDEPEIALVARQLGIPYAPCLCGFEGRLNDRKPVIRGVVVHEHNQELLWEASAEVAKRRAEEVHEQRRKAICLKWKRLFIGVLTEDRLEREYG
jgi:Rad4 beta-hairpin domain 3/Rad4 beta-hairpin domain 1/Rad4 beta-hairpin domain 2